MNRPSHARTRVPLALLTLLGSACAGQVPTGGRDAAAVRDGTGIADGSASTDGRSGSDATPSDGPTLDRTPDTDGPPIDGAPTGCVPQPAATSAGGGRCADLDRAWTARGINVGYYPFRVLAPLEQYSGDYSGAPGAIFTAGGAHKGVLLQMIPAGSYVGLSSSGPWYAPPTDCFPTGQSCGASYRAACAATSPPLRPPLGGAQGSFFWGYAYQGASHMQGWIPWDPSRLAFVGHDPAHPCALGPAGADFEVPTACGKPTSCSGANISCGKANPCSEGADDCGNAACGAQSGGPLTPTAHVKKVRPPPAAVACSSRTPPHPSVKCLPNGGTLDFFFVYPFGAYLYWAQNSTTKHWLHHGDTVQSYFHNRDAQGVLWDFVEVLQSGAPVLTPSSSGSGAAAPCSASNPSACTPCQNGGACGWIQAVFLE